MLIGMCFSGVTGSEAGQSRGEVLELCANGREQFTCTYCVSEMLWLLSRNCKILSGIYLIFPIHSAILSFGKPFIKSHVGLCLLSNLQKGPVSYTY